ncbi:alpha-tocopherol transfer protein-like [Dreissena polymorpha]|nr:alpha-tocopherol transfer protein-like [Dreissena polymorpha]
MRMGAFYASPKRDKHGRIVMFGGFEKLDTEFFKSVGVSKMYHMSALLCDWLTFNEHAQVNGVVFVSNYAGITWSMITTLYNPEFEKEFTSYFQKSLPIRVKSLDIFNEPPFFDAIWAMVSIILSKKLKSRFHLHGKSLVKIYNEIGYECIPDEYLPDDYEGPRAGTIAQVVEKMIEDMRRPEFLTYIRDLSSGKYGVDKSRIPAKTSDESPAASYRKINTD